MVLESTSTLNDTVPKVDGRAVIGNTWEFKKDRLELFQRTFETCGDLGVYSLAGEDVFLANSVELVHEILIKHGSLFEKTDRFRAFARPLLGDGLLTATNEDHKRNRRLIQPRFRTAVIRNSADSAAQVAGTVAERWEDGSVIDVRREMVRLVLGMVGRNLFSKDILGEADDLGNALTDAIHGFDSQASALVPLTIGWPTPANLRYRSAIRRLERTFYTFLAERRAMAEKPDDWLNLLMECTDDNGVPFDDKEIRDEALNMFMPGHETTATGLAWSFHLLSKYPKVYDRLLAESDEVLGGRLPTLEDLDRLPYALQVFKEAMRLYPPVYMFSRQATADVDILGHRIPAGASVIFSPYVLHRREDYFPDPQRFDPDRFAPEAEKQMRRHSYIPFGAGHRVCIGNHHALLGGHVALATIAGQVRLHSLPGPSPVKEPMVTLRPKGELRMRVTRRNQGTTATATPPPRTAEADAAPACPYGHQVETT
ncbi:cytochrome P450 [Streptomyces chumphonensis]|uniref:Cytochrome P450 n=1 Tax=Streptomyces chumphonensis TaxID=1214925 RepID=A0A927EUZ2_9ACTN|nr:cytochrome P450 [Streptomyces chumphonensis]MBD3929980.1 cytochrome P450 [Streptomyces chumphonensis]